MFTTLQVNQDKNSFEEVEPVTNHLACVYCRSKKLKCTGERDGCNRCRSKELPCEYLELAHGKGARNRAKSRLGSYGSPSPKSTYGCKSWTTNNLSSRPMHSRDASLEAAIATVNANESTRHYNAFSEPSTDETTPGVRSLTAGGITNEDLVGLDDRIFDTDMSSLNRCPTSDLSWALNFQSPRPVTSSSRNSTTGQGLSSGDGRSDHVFTSSPHSIGTDTTAVPSHRSPQSATLPHDHSKSFDIYHTQAFPRNDPAIPPPRRQGTHYKGSCQCSDTALVVLEALNVQNMSINQQTLAQTLRLNKIALSRCQRLLSCETCCVSSSFVMLVIVLCQNLVSSYERIIALLMQQLNELRFAHHLQRPTAFKGIRPPLGSRDSSDATARTARNDLLEATQRTKLQGYEIDSNEQPAVLGAITRFHLTCLKTFLCRIRDSLTQHNLSSHIGLIDSACSRVNSQLELSAKCPVPIFAT